MKTILDILPLVKYADVRRKIRCHYPTCKTDYRPVFDYLLKAKKAAHDDKDERIEVYCVRMPEKFCIDNYDRNGRYGISTNKYSMSFRKWNELANIPIAAKTLASYTNEDIIAHFLWEITYYGDQKRTKRIADKIAKRAQEIKSEL